MSAAFVLMIVTCSISHPKECKADVIAKDLTYIECMATSQPRAAHFFALMGQDRRVKSVMCTQGQEI